jgi:hypothetical protein
LAREGASAAVNGRDERALGGLRDEIAATGVAVTPVAAEINIEPVDGRAVRIFDRNPVE